MIAKDLALPGLKLIELKAHGDSRGFFVERYNAREFERLGIGNRFVQDNHSRSAPGVLRGLHFQHDPHQAKLVGVVAGRILDVVVDVRSSSPTFGRWHAEELSSDQFKLLFVPPGFAHGFCVLGDEPAEVLYKVDAIYDRAGESGISWNDPELAIRWPLESPEVSARDQKLLSWREYCTKPVY